MGADHLVERGFDAEAQRQGAARVEAARSTGDDTRNQLIGLAADARQDLVAGHAPQRGICLLVTQIPWQSLTL